MSDVITYDDAVKLLPAGDTIHTFRGGGFMMLGADWSRENILAAMQRAPEIRIAGEVASLLGHPLAIDDDGWLFIEAKSPAALKE